MQRPQGCTGVTADSEHYLVTVPLQVLEGQTGTLGIKRSLAGEVRGRLQEEAGWVELRDRGWEETLKLGEKRVGVKGRGWV